VSTTLYVCETCRFNADARTDAGDAGGRHGGELFLEHIERELAARPLPDLRIAPTRCLMACQRHCTVHLRAAGKITYVIGNFAPTAADARTVLDYVALYQRSDSGQVPYREWPEGIKGHFVSRTPPFE
jgi:predicted metal-binding protein